MKIAGLQKLSTVDYPGVLSAVVFTNGCNYNCWYCHNRELICGNAPCLSTKSILDYLNKRKKLIQGVVISGGEPTIHKTLREFILLIKSLGYLVKLDTNGSHPEVLKGCIDLLDYVAIDYKAPKNMYKDICGVENYSCILESLNILSESEVGWEIRTTMIPEILDMRDVIVDELNELNFKNKPHTHRFNEFRPVNA